MQSYNEFKTENYNEINAASRNAAIRQVNDWLCEHANYSKIKEYPITHLGDGKTEFRDGWGNPFVVLDVDYSHDKINYKLFFRNKKDFDLKWSNYDLIGEMKADAEQDSSYYSEENIRVRQHKIANAKAQGELLRLAAEKKKEIEERDRKVKQLARFNEAHSTATTLYPIDSKLSPYIIKKGIEDYVGFSMARYDTQNGILYIPAYGHNSKIQMYQTISDTGYKLYKGASKGAYTPILPINVKSIVNCSVIGISEGFATATSIAAAKNISMVCAFDAGNILPAIQSIIHAFKLVGKVAPKFALFADNDKWDKKQDTPSLRDPKSNTGVKAVNEAAQWLLGQDIQCEIYTPEFPQELDSHKLTDFNDMHVHMGLDAVEKVLPVVPILEVAQETTNKSPAQTSIHLLPPYQVAKLCNFKKYDKDDHATFPASQQIKALKSGNYNSDVNIVCSLLHHLYEYTFITKPKKNKEKQAAYDWHFIPEHEERAIINAVGHELFDSIVLPIKQRSNIAWRDNFIGDYSTLENVEIKTYSGKYVGDLRSYMVDSINDYYLACNTGDGKSYAVKEYFNSLTDKSKKKVTIAALTKLCRVSSTLFDIAHYEDLIQELKNSGSDFNTIIDKDVAITPNSLYKLILKSNYILFIDEIELSKSGLNSTTLYKDGFERGRAGNTLKDTIANADIFIAADANISTNTIKWCQEIRGNRPSILIKPLDTHSKRHKSECVVHIDKTIGLKQTTGIGMTDTKIIERVKKGERLIIGVAMGIDGIEGMANTLKQAVPSINVQTSHGGKGSQVDPFNVAVDNDPNNATLCDVFIYSTILGAGVSINDHVSVKRKDGKPHFDHAFYYLWNHGSSRMSSQMIARYRPDTPTTVFIDGSVKKARPTTQEALIAEKLAYLDSEIASLKVNTTLLIDDRNDKIANLDGVRRMMAAATHDSDVMNTLLEENLDRENFVENTIGFINSKFENVLFSEEKGQRQFLEATKEVKAGDKALVLKADKIDLQEYAQLKNKTTPTHDEWVSLKKYECSKFWNGLNLSGKVKHKGKYIDLYDIYEHVGNRKLKNVFSNIKTVLHTEVSDTQDSPYLTKPAYTNKYVLTTVLSSFLGKNNHITNYGIKADKTNELIKLIEENSETLGGLGLLERKKENNEYLTGKNALKQFFNLAFGAKLVMAKGQTHYKGGCIIDTDSKSELSEKIALFTPKSKELSAHQIMRNNAKKLAEKLAKN